MKPPFILRALLSVTLIGSFPAFADKSFFVDQGQITQLKDLENYSSGPNSADQSKLDAIRENGLKAGIQGGMIYRAKQIVNEIAPMSPTLDRAFNFQVLMEKTGWLPPIVQRVNRRVETKDMAQKITYAGIVYKITQKARFVRIVPTWRDYLYVGLYDEKITTDRLPEAIRPKTDEEKSIWKDAVKRGWADGIKQADEVFKENSNRLKSDMIGMITYRYLHTHGMIETPVMAVDPDAIKVTDDEIDILTGSRSIVVPSKMIKDPNKWGSGDE